MDWEVLTRISVLFTLAMFCLGTVRGVSHIVKFFKGLEGRMDKLTEANISMLGALERFLGKQP